MRNIWLLSQNALTSEYSDKLKNTTSDKYYEIYIGNWGLNDLIKNINDINLENLGYPTKVQGVYSMIRFKDDMKIGDIVVLIQNKKQIYGVGKIVGDIEYIDHEQGSIFYGNDSILFYRKISWIFKAEGGFFNLGEQNKIKRFKRTLDLLTETEYQNLENYLKNNKGIEDSEDKSLTESDKNQSYLNDISIDSYFQGEKGEALKNQIEEGIKEKIVNEIILEMEDKLATDKTSLISVFGIFASIVTFLSVEIQILKTICSFWKLVGFTLIMLSSLLLFILILDFIGKNWINFKNNKNTVIPNITWFILILLVSGIGISGIAGDENQCKENSIYQRYSDEFSQKLIQLKSF